MSLELRDLRLKITPETECALRARARATDKDLNAIARSVLEQWAAGELHAATVLAGLLKSEGLTRADGGMTGSLRSDKPHASLDPVLDLEVA